MSPISHSIEHGLWRLRAALNAPARSAAESVWRLRRLRQSPPGKPGRVRWNNRPFAYADGSAALLQLQEIFVAGVYDFVCPNPQPRILDCGAHTGCAVLRWRHFYPQARITAIEADAAIAGLLRENLREWNDFGTEVIQAAAWTHDGEIRFAATGKDNGLVSTDGATVVPSLDLARLCREQVDLLKLDIEGAEAVVLAHLAATGTLQNVRVLACEWHEWGHTAPRLHEALVHLAAAGLTYRIVQAETLGDRAMAVFPRLRLPGNQLMIYAWQP